MHLPYRKVIIKYCATNIPHVRVVYVQIITHCRLRFYDLQITNLRPYVPTIFIRRMFYRPTHLQG